MSVLIDINNVYSDLFEKEKSVADYVRNNFSCIANMSVMELAQKSGVSDATVMRFCKKIGFKGFYQFKISLIKEMSLTVESDLSGDIVMTDIEKAINKVFLAKIDGLQRCAKLLDSNVVKECINKIISCDTLYLFGAGNSNPVAMYASYQFNQYGIKTIANQMPEIQIQSAFGLNESDVSIILSNSGITSMIVDIAEIAKSRNSTIIAITESTKSNLASIADYILLSATSYEVRFDAYNSTRMCHMAIIDLLLILLSRSDDKRFYKTSTERENFFSKFKL